MKITFSEYAITDLKDIADYLLKEAGITTALKVTDKINQIITDTIANNPKIGTVVSFIPKSQIRFFPSGKYAYNIFYKSLKTEIVIIRILHKRRDIRNLLK